MDSAEELLSGRAARRRWLFALAALPLIALLAVGAYLLLERRQTTRDRELVEQTTSAAFGCVAAIRGDAPQSWGLERSLEHMSRMARVTAEADASDEARARFARLAADAARGCEALGSLMRRATEESSALYFGVPAKLAQAPDLDAPERWYRRVLPASREQSVELTRQIRMMAEAVNARRAEHALMTQELPVEGQGASELARVIELAPVPRDRERAQTEVWPLSQHVFALRRAAIGAVPCDMRFINRLSCFDEYVQTIDWTGETSAPLALERPERVSYWSSFAPTPDGALWAVGAGARRRGLVGRYPPGEARPEIIELGAEVDAGATIEAVRGGQVGVRLSDGSVLVSSTDAPSFAPAESMPRALVMEAAPGEGERSLFLTEYGTLSLFGSEDFGWTSRLNDPQGEQPDALFRVIEAHRRVQSIAALRSLPSGKVVALLQRFESAPDAVVLSTDFGRTWLSRAADDES